MNALVFKRSGHRERGKIDETETLSRLEEGNVEPVVGGTKGRDSRMERGHRRDVPGSDGEAKLPRYASPCLASAGLASSLLVSPRLASPRFFAIGHRPSDQRDRRGTVDVSES
ncbi:hypothetical protein EAG_10515 [Camponotus floridanus]|uniref:Uncharacterized protein n=1 Tax=Camponotus floridanus TaxID=104421 RepID=E2AF22_CAMFO|nr:hypothetical protein EAG_10515 [Camponotus floridanus]